MDTDITQLPSLALTSRDQSSTLLTCFLVFWVYTNVYINCGIHTVKIIPGRDMALGIWAGSQQEYNRIVIY